MDKQGMVIRDSLRQGNTRYRWYLYAADGKLVCQGPTSFSSYVDCYTAWKEAEAVFENTVHVVPRWKKFLGLTD